MGKETGIEWAESTVNFWLGCVKKSPACKNCYAERLSENLMGRSFADIRRTSDKTFYAARKWDEPRMIFACSMSDFFLEAADPWRSDAWDVIRETPQHTWMILTKRPERIHRCLPYDWGDGWENVWLGVSVELQQYVHRVDTLAAMPAALRFVSAEPLLGPITFRIHASSPLNLLETVDWMIVGGESGPKPRPMSEWWIREIQEECDMAGVPFFFKQHGGSRKCECHRAWGCCLLDERIYDAMPEGRI